MGKIAAELLDACNDRERRGAEPGLRADIVAAGDDWFVEDVLCTYRPSDAAFEERHGRYRVALVGAGAFDCRTAAGRALLTPGALLLGNAGECFECNHVHGSGDRCLAFAYEPQMFERLAFEAGVRDQRHFRSARVPPLGALAPLVAEACTAWATAAARSVWEELGVRMAAAAVRFAAEPQRAPRSPANADRGVARAARLIEHDPCAELGLEALAREAGLSRFHFLRAFARATGLTPHQYVRRARLRRAAVRLATGRERIVGVALASGFGDVSNFNHAFRAEFGASPRAYRARATAQRGR